MRWHAAFFMGRRGELRINDNYFLETKIRATPYKNIKKSRNCVKTIIVNSRIYLFNDNRDNIPLESTSSSGKEYYYQQHKQLYLTTCFASNNTASGGGDDLTTIETMFRGNQLPAATRGVNTKYARPKLQFIVENYLTTIERRCRETLGQ